MSGNSNNNVNAAYVALWKSKNKNLVDIDTDGDYLFYNKEKIDIRDVYMQDILRNSTISTAIHQMDSPTFVQIIKMHKTALDMKKIELEEKVRRYNMSEKTLSNNENGISIERFFDLIAMTEEEINSNAIYMLQIEEFKHKIKNFQEWEEASMLTEPALSLLQQFNQKARALLNKENRTVQEDEIVQQLTFDSDDVQENAVTMSRVKKKQANVPTNKAGHIDAVIILIMLLNIGFIIAMTILGNR